MTKIMGVDFSGAGTDNHVGNTWMTQGRLDGNTLALETQENPRPISRACLTNKLAGLSEPAVAAMDFPFSVPREFANFWQPNAQAMPALWEAAAGVDIRGFTNLRDSFAKDRRAGEKEPKRPCDPPESISPLNIRMRSMTLAGMQMLHQLWHRFEGGEINRPLRIPPLHPDPELDSLTLLEVMPGATLRSFGLPHTEYKDTLVLTPEQRERRREMRQHILDELPRRTNPLTVNLPGDVYDICLDDADALDSVVAAITAALWVIDRERFIMPPEQGHPNYAQVMLEGWLYIPRRRCENCEVIL